MREVRVAVFGFVENGKFNSKQIYCMEFFVVALVGAKNVVWLVRSQRKYAFPKNPNQKRCNENLVVLAKSHVIENI